VLGAHGHSGGACAAHLDEAQLKALTEHPTWSD
jgi:hypothetical protein